MKTILKYGDHFPGDFTPLEIEFRCIQRFGRWTNRQDRKCGEGLPFHVKRAMQILWPTMEWHRWVELIVDEFLKSPGRTACLGASSSGKSFVFSRSALVMFYARPHGTTVLISSTTRDALTRRIWDYIVSSDKEARRSVPWLPGSLIESKLMLLADAATEDGRSFKNGIVGVACRVGNSIRGLSEYVGTKNDVLILICDEAALMPVGFLDALANLESNEPCYAAIIGNLPDVHNPLGWAAEPKLGWDSLPDTDKTRVYQTKWKNGRAIQLIGMDSPNMDYPEGQEPFKKLIGRRYIEQCRQNYGEDSDKFNMFASGKIPRASMTRTAFSKSQCLKFHAMEPVTWGHEPVIRGYCLDAAYSGLGGDRTPGCPFVFGKDIKGFWRLWFGRMLIYPGSATPKLSHAEAIALQTKEECEAAGIEPEHVFFDGTGRSELTIAFARLWSAKVVPLEFGGVATERPVFTKERKFDGMNPGEIKTCRETYANFVTELCFALSCGITSDQVRGLSEEMVDEGCQRKWEFLRGAKQQIEPKDKMKLRGLRSCDLLDCIVCGVEGARRLGFPLGDTLAPQSKRRTALWLEEQREEEWKKIGKEQLQVA